MSKDIQTRKNIELTHRLMLYLISGKDIPELPEDVSFVAFSKSDKKLNEANQKLLEVIIKDNKPVAIAEEPKDKNESWKITPANF